jgi:hypothetical protein
MARRGVTPAAILGILLAVGLLGGGVFILATQQTGDRAQAIVTDCARVIRGGYCSGTWVAGGDLVGGEGRVVSGTIEGAGPGDVGKTLDVRLSGDRAYSTSMRLPLILIGSGLVAAVLVVFEMRKARRVPAPPARG